MKKKAQLTLLFFSILLLGASLYQMDGPKEKREKVNQASNVVRHSKIYSNIDSRRKKLTIKKQSTMTKRTPSPAMSLLIAAKRMQKGKFSQEYIEQLLKAKEVDPENQEVSALLAEAYLENQQDDLARELATDCLALSKTNSLCHQVLISSFTRKEEYDESYPYLLDCLNDDPSNIYCNSALFQHHLRNEDQDASKVLLKSMIKNAPSSIYTMISAGDYFNSKDDFKKAKKYYRSACAKKSYYACGKLEELEELTFESEEDFSNE